MGPGLAEMPVWRRAIRLSVVCYPGRHLGSAMEPVAPVLGSGPRPLGRRTGQPVPGENANRSSM